jgi:hypothetical protein
VAEDLLEVVVRGYEHGQRHLGARAALPSGGLALDETGRAGRGPGARMARQSPCGSSRVLRLRVAALDRHSRSGPAGRVY